MNNKKITSKITSKDVANLAGVSQSTVSRVFNPNSNRNVKEEIKIKVKDAAQKLGYKPNILARSLVSKKTNMIGVVVANPIGPFYSQIIIDLTSKLQDNGAQPLFFILKDRLNIQKIMDKVFQYQVDGVIITSSALLSSYIADELIKNKLPTVLFNINIKNSKISSIYTDNIKAGKLVANLLLDKGHKNILYVNYENNAIAVENRKKGFYQIIKDNSMLNIEEVNCDYSYEQGYEIGLKILNKKNIPDAIFCVSDLTAMGIMDAIKHNSKLNIPNDISIIGFDNIPQASWKAYEITTVHQPTTELINRTIEVLFELINNKDGKYKYIEEKISPTLIIRKSTR